MQLTRPLVAGCLGASFALGTTIDPAAQPAPFRLEEATIDDVHRGIRAGQITCRGLVEAYLARARAYNGISSQLVTADGAPVPPVAGAVRAGVPLRFPTATVPIRTLLPDFDDYVGPPLEFGRMEPTASDPSVYQQFGMIVGTADAGQVNALATLNLRGERSVTCRGDFDRHPSAGPLPPGAPPVCEEFRQQPDALERAAELDRRYGRRPDLNKLPLYCIPFALKDPFDTTDMRTTAGADARYDIDFPARDHTLVARLRASGAIIYAKSVATEYNGRAWDPGGRHRPTRVFVSTLGYQRSTWSGNPANPYDTTRAASLGSSSGSGVAVSTNLVMCGLCEETTLSCRGPANHNAIALILPHKGFLSYHGGAIGADIQYDRAGIHCRTIADAAKVLDALRDPERGYYDPRDVWTTVPRATIPAGSYAASAASPGKRGALRGLRLGIVRESMLIFPGIKADEPIVTAAAREIKAVLGAHLGATLVESVDPLWPDDPEIENMTTTYPRALAALVPVIFPDLLYRLTPDGTPLFPEFAALITPTEFAPGKFFGSGSMRPIDYMVALAEGRVAPPKNLNIRVLASQRTGQQIANSNSFRFHFVQYATRRAADWAARGYTETLVDFPTLNARSKFWGDDQRAAFKNWEEIDELRNPLAARQGIHERALLGELLRRVEMKVMYENRLDLVVRLHYSLPPGKIGLAPEPEPPGETRGEIRMGPYAGLTEVLVPAGYVRTVYDPSFELSPDKRRYVPRTGTTPTTLPPPGLPFSLVFRAEPGREPGVLRVASAYEAASKRRVPPPAFGPLPHERPAGRPAASFGTPRRGPQAAGRQRR
jgi:amidase